jgi:predicted RNase H-like HicB family nuclease
MAESKHKKHEIVPGTIVKCQSGRYIAYYEHRTDIIANGDNEKDAKKNLKKMYKIVRDHEESESETPPMILPPDTKTKSFSEKLVCK